jgi:hypothetical protein
MVARVRRGLITPSVVLNLLWREQIEPYVRDARDR